MRFSASVSVGYWAVAWVLVTSLGYASCDKDDAESQEEYCLTTRGVVQCLKADEVKLNRLDGKQIGETEVVDTGEGRPLMMKTVSHKPLVFEIPEFLTKAECGYFINLAKEEGLENSRTTENTYGNKGFQLMDKNRDKRLNIEEMRLSIQGGFDTYLDDEDILKMYEALQLDADGDNHITPKELEKFHPSHIKAFLDDYLQTYPEKHSRYSKQVWLYPDTSQDTLFTVVQKRVAHVVNLPDELIKLSDFQVVTYGIKGHYNSHFDSAKKDSVPCCTRERTQGCRICRYMTVLFYLSDVLEGGETAFPLAGNETADLMAAQEKELINLYKKCKSGLRVAPQAGKAIIWYNHNVDDETGWLGDQDDYTLHGGCPVTKGTKWIANFWIKATDSKYNDLVRMRKFMKTSTHYEEHKHKDKEEL